MIELERRYPQPLQRTGHPLTTLVQYMRIDHGGGHIRVPEQFLNRADVTTLFQQVCGEGVP